MQPAITLIIPVYNGERYLSELLDTVCAQTYSEWTCLCVNDGSTDDSERIIRNYMSRDPRFQLITKENGGTGSARNIGLSNVKTPYIMFADQDDWLHPQCFEVAHTLIESSGADVLTFERTRVYFGSFKPAPVVIGKLMSHPLPILPEEQFITRGAKYTCFVWQRIYRTASLQGIFFPEVSGGEDIVFMYELSCQAKKWVECDVVLYGIRENRHSTSRTVSNRYIKNFFLALKAFSSTLEKHGVETGYRKRFLTQSVFGFCIICILFNGRKSEAPQTFDQLREFICDAEANELMTAGRTLVQRIIEWVILRRLHFLLRCFSWLLCPYFERHYIKALITRGFGSDPH